MSDKNTPTDTLASLDAEAKPEPYVLGIGGKLISFPDPMELDFEESDRFLSEIRNMSDTGDFLRRWLSEEDYETFRKAKPTGRQVSVLIRRLLEHYELVLGDEGEGRTSGTA